MTVNEWRNKPTDKVKGTETGNATHRRTSIEKHLRKHPLFILPDGSNRDAVYRLGQRFLDLTVEALSGADRRPRGLHARGNPAILRARTSACLRPEQEIS